MSSSFIESLIAQLIVTLISVGIPAYVLLRKWGTEKTAIDSSSDKIEAETASLWHETYEKMYRAGIERDERIALLVRQGGERDAEILKLNTKLDLKTLSEERVQTENAELKQRVLELEQTLIKERAEHAHEIQSLKDRLSILEQNNVGTTVSPLSSN